MRDGGATQSPTDRAQEPNFLSLVEAATDYPCLKRAWVEYLGERPDPAIDRVDVAAAAPAAR